MKFRRMVRGKKRKEKEKWIDNDYRNFTYETTYSTGYTDI